MSNEAIRRVFEPGVRIGNEQAYFPSLTCSVFGESPDNQSKRFSPEQVFCSKRVAGRNRVCRPTGEGMELGLSKTSQLNKRQQCRSPDRPTIAGQRRFGKPLREGQAGVNPLQVNSGVEDPTRTPATRITISQRTAAPFLTEWGSSIVSSRMSAKDHDGQLNQG
jgi:hypothetical protein